VSANVSALSQSAAQIGPMSDTLGHLNEAILSLRQDLPQIAEQTAERTQGQVLTALAQKGENPELAEKLAIVQNLLLSRAVEQRESDTRSHGALESIRDLVQNLHHRIDAMEAAEEPVLHDVPAAATAAAAPVLVAAPMATQGPRVVHSAPEVESTEAPTVSAQAMSAPAPAAAQPEPTRSPTADLRTFVPVAPAKPAGLAGLLRSPVGMVAMVVLLAISLGMIYAKVMRKPAQPGAPKVVIEQTTVPAMPAELPEAVTPAAVAKPAAAVPLIVPPNDKPAQSAAR
jgi:hypothetical protein